MPKIKASIPYSFTTKQTGKTRNPNLIFQTKKKKTIIFSKKQTKPLAYKPLAYESGKHSRQIKRVANLKNNNA